MQRGQLKDISSWMARFLPEPLDSLTKSSENQKMFGSKTTGSCSTFYTDLEDPENEEMILQEFNKNQNSSDSQTISEDGNFQDSDSPVCLDESQQQEQKPEEQQYTNHSFHRIASFGGFSRFQPFVMSASSPNKFNNIKTNEETTSIVQMSHSLLEYRTSRFYSTTRTTSRTTTCTSPCTTRISYKEDSNQEHHVESYENSESESDEEVLEKKEDQDKEKEVETKSSSDTGLRNIPHDNHACNELNSFIRIDNYDLKRKEARNVAQELLETEKKYVNILHLIDQVFQFRVDQENRAHPMFPQETVQHMFSNIKSIYKFHNDFLLPQLEERMKNWDINSKIGDIMKNFAPFLKMYTEYVKNFDYAMNLISTLQQKISRFAAIISEIQKLDECAKLSLSHHMLSPIQRLPRYELLLKDYMKNLTDDSQDYEDTKKALELVSRATNHTNEAMKKIDKFKKLLEIQESIHDITDLVSATRELIKEGRIIKISARSGDHQERYLFLFSDILLLCSIRLIPGPLYRLRAKFLIENLEVVEGDNLETANTFYLRYGNKNIELYTDSAAEKVSWLDALFQTMQEIMRRRASLKTNDTKTTIIVKAHDVNKCMVCEVIFSVMKRKYNCRACGIIVCSKCSNQKLLFEDNKNMRVCPSCYAALTQPLNKSPTSPDSVTPIAATTAAGSVPPSLLQVSANAPESVLSGYLLLKTQASKPWTRRWFSLHPDFVLYTFKSDSENLALTATPMPGYTLTGGLELPDEDPLNPRDRKGTFKIHHSRKYYYLQAFSQQDEDRWMHALNLATKAESILTIKDAT